MNRPTRWLSGPRFIIPGERGPAVRALEIDAAGTIVGWAERVPGHARASAQALPGQVAIAGLHDAHVHLDWLGAEGEELDLTETTELKLLRARLEGWERTHQDDPVLVGRGVVLDSFTGDERPHWRLLEGIGDRPILLRSRDGHALWLNRAAMRAAPAAWPQDDPPGGRIERDAAGEPTGVLVDGAMDPALPLLERLQRDEGTLERRLRRALARCVEEGLTSDHTMALPPEAVEPLVMLAASGELPVRVFAYLDGSRAESWDRIDNPAHLGARFHLSGIKLFADGALGSRGAAMLAAYDDEPTCCGHLRYPPEELRHLVATGHARGVQLAIHAIGDHGNRVTLDALEGLPAVASARHRIEHAQIVDPVDRARFASLGVVASMQPCHATSDAQWVERRLGRERLAHAYPWTQLAREGVPLAFGTDAPIEGLAPGPAMACAARTANVSPNRPAPTGTRGREPAASNAPATKNGIAGVR